MDYETLLERLRADYGRWNQIGQSTGVSQSLISRYVAGDLVPKVTNFEKLVAHYKGPKRARRP